MCTHRVSSRGTRYQSWKDFRERIETFSLSELTLYEEVKQRARKLRGREENGQNSTATVNFTIPNINFLLSEKEENLLSCSLLDR